ncbi:hypothetical protein PHMEG_0005424 [Phytophthora megakarya]|uniref:Uncharacterized protein n=1 Tax=Phytophthora megakarya TaxID=4795 RepID=A0A225WTD4_9STRA|nr:hypothetical protein PHMEG_0005424 [Phytophthora megakarya]
MQLRRSLAERDRNLLIQEISLTRAAERIERLTRQIQVARQMTARAEQAQRDAEADYMLRHLIRDSDDGDAAPVTVEVTLQSQAEQRVVELEDELKWIRDSAETMSTELQATKDDKSNLEMELQALKVVRNELELDINDVDEEVDWKAIANIRQELVAVLTAQVKSMHAEKTKLEHAVVCCQRSADKRLLDLEKAWQVSEEENIRLRGRLYNLQQRLKIMSSKFREFEIEDLNEILTGEEKLEKRLAKAQASQTKLNARVEEIEQMLIPSRPGADAARNRQLMMENNELLRQLEEERDHTKQLIRSTSLFKKSTESALNELKNVETELRAICRTQTCCDELHETVKSLARQVVADFLERYWLVFSAPDAIRTVL